MFSKAATISSTVEEGVRFRWVSWAQTGFGMSSPRSPELAGMLFDSDINCGRSHMNL